LSSLGFSHELASFRCRRPRRLNIEAIAVLPCRGLRRSKCGFWNFRRTNAGRYGSVASPDPIAGLSLDSKMRSQRQILSRTLSRLRLKLRTAGTRRRTLTGLRLSGTATRSKQAHAEDPVGRNVAYPLCLSIISPDRRCPANARFRSLSILLKMARGQGEIHYHGRTGNQLRYVDVALIDF
jgi:hypothetical protein